MTFCSQNYVLPQLFIHVYILIMKKKWFQKLSNHKDMVEKNQFEIFWKNTIYFEQTKIVEYVKASNFLCFAMKTKNICFPYLSFFQILVHLLVWFSNVHVPMWFISFNSWMNWEFSLYTSWKECTFFSSQPVVYMNFFIASR